MGGGGAVGLPFGAEHVDADPRAHAAHPADAAGGVAGRRRDAGAADASSAAAAASTGVGAVDGPAAAAAAAARPQRRRRRRAEKDAGRRNGGRRRRLPAPIRRLFRPHQKYRGTFFLLIFTEFYRVLPSFT